MQLFVRTSDVLTHSLLEDKKVYFNLSLKNLAKFQFIRQILPHTQFYESHVVAVKVSMISHFEVILSEFNKKVITVSLAKVLVKISHSVLVRRPFMSVSRPQQETRRNI